MNVLAMESESLCLQNRVNCISILKASSLVSPRWTLLTDRTQRSQEFVHGIVENELWNTRHYLAGLHYACMHVRIHLSEISGSHGGEYEDYLSSGLLRYVVW